MSLLEYDELRLLRGESHPVTEKISVNHPTLQDVYDLTEKKYYGILSTICSTPADCKAQLYMAGVDFEEISDFELFISMAGEMPYEETSVFIKGIDFSKTQLAKKVDSDDLQLIDFENDIIFDKIQYTIITDFLRKVHGFKKNEEYAGTQKTKQIMIDMAMRELELSATKKFQSTLGPLVSSMTNCSEFKYNIRNVWDLPMYTFMDSVKRIQKIKDYSSIMSGVCGGWVDKNSFPPEAFDWMGEL